MKVWARLLLRFKLQSFAAGVAFPYSGRVTQVSLLMLFKLPKSLYSSHYKTLYQSFSLCKQVTLMSWLAVLWRQHPLFTVWVPQSCCWGPGFCWSVVWAASITADKTRICTLPALLLGTQPALCGWDLCRLNMVLDSAINTETKQLPD